MASGQGLLSAPLFHGMNSGKDRLPEVLQAQHVQGVAPSVLGVQQPQGGFSLVAEECAKDEAAHRYEHDGRVAAGWSQCLSDHWPCFTVLQTHLFSSRT